MWKSRSPPILLKPILCRVGFSCFSFSYRADRADEVDRANGAAGANEVNGANKADGANRANGADEANRADEFYGIDISVHNAS